MFLRIMSILLSVCFLFSSSTYASSFAKIPCDIVIDVGHGGVDGGTSNHGVLEKDINLAVGRKLGAKLQALGYLVKLTREEDIALSEEHPSKFGSRHRRDLERRKWIAEALNPKLFMSLHVNWSSNRKTRGPIVFYRAKDETSKQLARLAQKELNEVFQVKRGPMAGKTYFLLNHVRVPAVIVEMGFMSHSRDFQMLKQDLVQEKISLALAKAVAEFLSSNPSSPETN